MKKRFPTVGRPAFLALTAALFAMLASVASAATYYVDSVGGNDGNSGTTTVSPWKTLSKVSSITYAAGDTIRFMKDRQFSGMLTLNGNGISASKITVDSYGTGTNKPVIIGSGITLNNTNDLVTDAAIMLINRSWWVIQNIEVQGPLTNGLCIGASDNISVLNCNFTNLMWHPPGGPGQFQCCAIRVQPINSAGNDPGFNILLDHLYFNKISIGVWVESGDNVTLSNSYFYNVHEIPALTAGHVSGSTVINSHFTNNIFDYADNSADGWNIFMFGGANNCYFEHNEVRNQTAGINDHQVFDYDTAVKNSYFQYNYVHDCENGDIMHNYWAGAAADNTGDVFRYNLIVGGKTLYWPGATSGLQFYNNTFYNFKGTFGRNPIAGDVGDTVFKNNIFYMNSVLTGTWSFPGGSDYNCYFNATKPAAETHSIQANPLFVYGPNPPHGLQIFSTSPCKNAGTSIANNGGVDYWGHTLYSGLADIGAHEYDGTSAPNNVNLAMHKTVTSGTSVENWGWFRQYLVDDMPDSIAGFTGFPSIMGFHSTPTSSNHSEWITVDLGANYTFNRVKLYPRNDDDWVGEYFPVSFVISCSPDNTTWTTLATLTNYPKPGNEPQYFSFSNQTARYVNVGTIGTTGLRQAQGGTYAMAFAEMQVLNDPSTPPTPYAAPAGANLALNRMVTASSSAEDWGWFKKALVDGYRSSYNNSFPWGGSNGYSSWANQSVNHTEWFKIDLNVITTVSKVDLYPRNDSGYVGEQFPVNFTIDTSTDNINWTTRVTQTGYGKPSTGQSFPFAAASARYVRLNATSLRILGSSYLMALAEMEIY
jgi:hypothetical protein